jgi:hypothetical protein
MAKAMAFLLCLAILGILVYYLLPFIILIAVLALILYEMSKEENNK